MGLLDKFIENKTIRIECEGATLVDLDEVHWFQGELKTLSEQDYVKLRTSIEELGFSDPLNIWIDKDGKKWIHDGHERVFTLKKMREEGWVIPPLPASLVIAPNKKVAKKKLLANDGNYGKITETGFSDFVNEEDSKIDFAEIEDWAELPEVDLTAGDPADSDESDGGSKRECETCTQYHNNDHTA